MKTIGLTVVNLMVPCRCACKYCLLRSCKKADGVQYEQSQEIALRFNKWRKEKDLKAFELYHSIGYNMDFPQLSDNIALNTSFENVGSDVVQINGIGFKTKDALNNYLKNAKDAGLKTIDTTFFGLREFHDKFSARSGDFDYLLDIILTSLELGLKSNISFVALENNKDQLEELISILRQKTNNNENVSMYGFIPSYWGNGDKVEQYRLTQNSYDAMSPQIKKYLYLSRYKTESEWLKDNNFTDFITRTLFLTLRPDNIDKFTNMNCDSTIEYLTELDDAYYAAIPNIHTLAKIYGEKENQKLYRQRDLFWMWSRQYIKDNNLKLHDMTDQRQCSSLRA